MTAIPAEFTADVTRVPRGIAGEQRVNYLSLTDSQRLVYRYHRDVCGRLAAHCYSLATGVELWPGAQTRAH